MVRRLLGRQRISAGASAVKEPGDFYVKKSSSQVRSPGVQDAAKGSPVLNHLTDLHCTYCTGCVMKSEKVNCNEWKAMHLRHLDFAFTVKNITAFFSVHTIIEAKQDVARTVNISAGSYDLLALV